MDIVDIQKEFNEEMARVKAKRKTPEVQMYAKSLRDIIDQTEKDMNPVSDLIDTFHAAILEGRVGYSDDPFVCRLMASGMAMGYLLMKGSN